MKATHNEMRAVPIVGTELRVDPDGSVWRTADRPGGGPLRLVTPRRADRPQRDGYHGVRVRVDGRNIFVMAHRLVWVLSRGPIPDGMEINHKDRNKANNRLENLEVVTPSENVRHGYALGRAVARGEKINTAVLTQDAVREIRARHASGESCSEIAGSVGVGRGTIHRVAMRLSWRWVA